MCRAVTLVLGGVATAVATGGCGRIGFQVENEPVSSVTVAPAYPSNGAAWNSYVVNDGADAWSASDTPCTSATTYSSCLHGGELRVATLVGPTSCAGLSLTDALGVFQWTCQETSGRVMFYSSLASERGLRQLLDANGWLPESVTVTDGVASAPATWWSNPVLPLPDNSTSVVPLAPLDQPETIYVAATSMTTNGYSFGAAGTALVTLPGVMLTFSTGSTVASEVQASGVDRIWLEATLDGTATEYGVHLAGGELAQINATAVTGGGVGGGSGAGVLLDGTAATIVRGLTSLASGYHGVQIGFDTNPQTTGSYFANLAIASSGSNGLYVDNAADDVFTDVRVANAGGNGLSLGSFCDDGTVGTNVYTHVRAYANHSQGVFVNSTHQLVVDAVAVSNGNDGFVFTNSCGYPWGSTLVGAVAAFNGGPGVELDDHNMTFANVVSVDNGSDGFLLAGTSEWSNLAASDSQPDVQLSAAAWIDGNLVVGSNASCSNGSGYAGLADQTCVANGSSSFTLYYRGSLVDDFVGEVASDSANTSAVAGSATFPTTTSFDWLDFSDPYRVWGQWRVASLWATGTGQILDFRLLAAAANLRDTTGAVATPNQPFVADAACPSAVSGNAAVQNHDDDRGYGNLPDQTYLLAAIEIVDPASPGYSPHGDHDGLCESGESCLYAPNFGAYQGEGTLATCVFEGGLVTDVTMWGYETNGVP